ncbi:hypothetical protein [Actinoplanes sp. NPDC026619]|uniref:hypothetical protein n=1 Tax=Actinoplanes sp. NPDC026619 TaxID=3155798 RepID=UPI0033D4A770
MTGALTRGRFLFILGDMERRAEMSDKTQVGDESRLAVMEADLPEPPDHDDEVAESNQPEPEEVPDAVLHQ